MKRRLSSVLLFLLFSLVASFARAEIRPGFELGIFGGSVTASAGINKAATSNRRITTNITNGNIYGLRFGGNFSRYFGIEMALADAGTKYNAYLLDQTGDRRSSEENSSIGLFNFNALLQFPLGPVVPFVTAGVGRAMFIDYALATTSYGAGVKIFLSKHFFLRVDYKKYIVNDEHTIYEEDYNLSNNQFYQIPYAYSDKIRLNEISVGTSILF